MNNALVQKLTAMRNEIFDLANSQAGNDKGNAAAYLHASANEMTRAIRCLERGNPPSEPIPMRFILASAGIHAED